MIYADSEIKLKKFYENWNDFEIRYEISRRDDYEIIYERNEELGIIIYK